MKQAQTVPKQCSLLGALDADSFGRTNWCLDSGATSHMCCDENLVLFNERHARILQSEGWLYISSEENWKSLYIRWKVQSVYPISWRRTWCVELKVVVSHKIYPVVSMYKHKHVFYILSHFHINRKTEPDILVLVLTDVSTIDIFHVYRWQVSSHVCLLFERQRRGILKVCGSQETCGEVNWKRQ